MVIMDFLKDSRKKKQFLCSYAAFIINGMLALSIGSLLPFIRDERGLDYAFCGMIVSLHSVGNLISSFISGILPMYKTGFFVAFGTDIAGVHIVIIDCVRKTFYFLAEVHICKAENTVFPKIH